MDQPRSTFCSYKRNRSSANGTPWANRVSATMRRGCTSSHSHTPMGGTRTRSCAQSTTGFVMKSSRLCRPVGTTTSPARSGSTVVMTLRMRIRAASTLSVRAPGSARIEGDMRHLGLEGFWWKPLAASRDAHEAASGTYKKEAQGAPVSSFGRIGLSNRGSANGSSPRLFRISLNVRRPSRASNSSSLRRWSRLRGEQSAKLTATSGP